MSRDFRQGPGLSAAGAAEVVMPNDGHARCRRALADGDHRYAVIALTFLFGFGNVLSLGLRLGVPVYVAPLVAPAVDLSVLGLLVGTRHLALHGASREQLRPAQRLLMFASSVTLALNVAEPICADQIGKAAFDAVGPLLLIGWAEVGPGLLQVIREVHRDGQVEGDPDVGTAEALHSEDAAPRTAVNNAAGQAGDNTSPYAWVGCRGGPVGCRGVPFGYRALGEAPATDLRGDVAP